MKFIGDILANTTAQIPFPMYVGALESLRGNIIGTSTGFNSVAPDNVTVYNFLQVIADDPFLFDFSRLMNETFPLTMLAADPALAQMTEVVNRVRSTGPLKLSSRINGTKYVVRVDVLTNVTWSLPWVTLQYLDEDSILSSINRTSDKVEIVVLVLIAFAVALGTSFSVFISMQIRAVVRQIAELKRMRFQEVLQYCSSYSSKGVAAPGMNSFVAELYELQLSFYDMTLKFAEHIKMNRRLLRNNNPV
ncbi:hypothetical protein DFJ73DRAFT_19397 [Zopfochytrium polystomum]|nr:hypothetical protein DFJ73DRAFT_19397 [Zopfochytrium polystomum]